MADWKLSHEDGTSYKLPTTMVFVGSSECDINIEVRYDWLVMQYLCLRNKRKFYPQTSKKSCQMGVRI